MQVDTSPAVDRPPTPPRTRRPHRTRRVRAEPPTPHLQPRPARANELARHASTARRALRWAGAHPRTIGFVAIGVAVLGFSGAWPGQIVLDGPGTTVHLRLAIDHLQQGGGVPYWTSEMWAGTPSWALAPSLPILAMLPLAILLGPVGAMKFAILGGEPGRAGGAGRAGELGAAVRAGAASSTGADAGTPVAGT